jgi:hypothetical protein
VAKRRTIVIDAQGFVHVDGVKVARRVERNGQVCLQFVDKCKRRTSERGTRQVEVPAADFDRMVLNGPVIDHID